MIASIKKLASIRCYNFNTEFLALLGEVEERKGNGVRMCKQFYSFSHISKKIAPAHV